VPRERDPYPSPYDAVIFVANRAYLIIEREKRSFRAVRLTRKETRLVRDALDDAHADVEARIVRRVLERVRAR
jgi:hypothetical protein